MGSGRRRYLIYLILSLLVISYLLSSYSHAPTGQRVIKVLDGDSIILANGEEVRYLGIDTPEYGQPFAEEAREFNRRLVKDRTVELEFDIEKRDHYGRLLAYVFVGKTFVNAELVKAGYAYVYTNPPNVKYRKLFLRLQKEARENRRGLWSREVPDTEPYYVASRRSTKFHRPWCKWAQKIYPKNLVILKSRQEALDRGLSPCKLCNP